MNRLVPMAIAAIAALAVMIVLVVLDGGEWAQVAGFAAVTFAALSIRSSP